MNVFARDLLANGNLLVSVTVSGTAPDQRFESHSPHLSADGNFVAFVSTATDLCRKEPLQQKNLFPTRSTTANDCLRIARAAAVPRFFHQ